MKISIHTNPTQLIRLCLMLLNIQAQTLPPTVPDPALINLVVGAMNTGAQTYEEYYVPMKFYSISSIKAYNSITGSKTMPGFDVTFSPDSNRCPTCTDATFSFGNRSATYDVNEITHTLSSEIVEATVCFDSLPYAGQDLEGFSFLHENGTPTLFFNDYGCDGGQPSDTLYDLPRRLIGFRTEKGLNPSVNGSGVAFEVITSISMIIDTENCEEAYWTTNGVLWSTNSDMTVEVNTSETLAFPMINLETIWGQTDCAFTETTAFFGDSLSFESSTKELTVPMTNDCGLVGYYGSFTMTLTPNQYFTPPDNYVPAITYSVFVEIACTINSFIFADTLQDLTYILGESAYDGHSLYMVYLPGPCECPSEELFAIQITKDGIPVTNPNVLQNDPETEHLFRFYSTDPADVGTYIVQIQGSIPIEESPGVDWTRQNSFQLVVELPHESVWCTIASLVINDTILSSLTITYTTGLAAHKEVLQASEIVLTPTVVCPAIEFDVVSKSGAQLGSPFTFDSNSNTFTILSSTPSDAQTYDLRITAKVQGQINTGTLDFQVIVLPGENFCEMTAVENFANEATEYRIYSNNSPAMITLYELPESNEDCTLPELDVLNEDDSPIDEAIFAYDKTFNIITISTQNTTAAGMYPMKLVNDGLTLVDFTITLVDFCASSQVTASSQDDPENYHYFGSTTFHLNPFTITPVECPITYSCLMVEGPVDHDLCNFVDRSTETSFSPTSGNFHFSSDYALGLGNATLVFEVTGSSRTSYATTSFSLNLTTEAVDAVVLNDETTVMGIPWSNLKNMFHESFDYEAFRSSLPNDQREIFDKLLEQENKLNGAAFIGGQVYHGEYARARIKEISVNGLVTIEIAEPVHTYLNFTEIQPDRLDVTFMQDEGALDDLTDPLGQSNFAPVVFSADELTIQLQFAQPLQVSQGSFNDMILISLYKPYFLAPEHLSDDEQLELFHLTRLSQNSSFYQTLWAEVPRQTKSELESTVLDYIGSSSKIIIIVAIIFPFLTQTLLKTFMNKLMWWWVSMMQLYHALSLLQINMPENVLKIQEKYTSIVQCQIIPKEQIQQIISLFRDETTAEQSNRRILTNNEDAPRQNQQHLLERFQLDFKDARTEISVYFLPILGVLFVAIVLSSILFACLRPACSAIRQRAMILKNMLMISGILRYIMQSYFTIALSAMFSVKNSFGGGKFDASTVVAVIMLLLLIDFLAFCHIFMQKNKDKLDEPKIRKRFGALYEPAMTDYKPTLMLPVLFCLRRLVIAVIIVWITNNFYLQILLVSWVSLFQTAWSIIIQPMESKSNNSIFIFNEYFFLFSCDFVLLFSDFVPTAEQRYTLGYIYLGFFLISFIINLGRLLHSYYKDIKAWWERRSLGKKSRQVQADKAEVKQEESSTVKFQSNIRERKQLDLPQIDEECSGDVSKDSPHSNMPSQLSYNQTSQEQLRLSTHNQLMDMMDTRESKKILTQEDAGIGAELTWKNQRGVKIAGAKIAGVKTSNVQTAGVKTASVKTASVKAASVKAPANMLRYSYSNPHEIARKTVTFHNESDGQFKREVDAIEDLFNQIKFKAQPVTPQPDLNWHSDDSEKSKQQESIGRMQLDIDLHEQLRNVEDDNSVITWKKRKAVKTESKPKTVMQCLKELRAEGEQWQTKKLKMLKKSKVIFKSEVKSQQQHRDVSNRQVQKKFQDMLRHDT